MPSELSIRDMTHADICAVFDLGSQMPELETMPGAGFASKDELAAHFERRGSRLVAVQDGRIVGFAIGAFGEPDAPAMPYACLVYVAVSKDRRGTGIGRWLVKAATASLASQGARQVYSLARADAPVERLLASEGFRSGHLYRWMELEIK